MPIPAQTRPVRFVTDMTDTGTKTTGTTADADTIKKENVKHEADA